MLFKDLTDLKNEKGTAVKKNENAEKGIKNVYL